MIGQIFYNAINAGRLAERHGAGFQDPPALHCSTIFHLKKSPGRSLGLTLALARTHRDGIILAPLRIKDR